MTETITDAMTALGFEDLGEGLYIMTVLEETLSVNVRHVAGDVKIRGTVLHHHQGGEPWAANQRAEHTERTGTHGTVGDATEAAAVLVAAELLGPTLDRAEDMLREALATYLPDDLQGYCGRVSFGFAADPHDYVESPGLELTIAGVHPMVEREAIAPDVAMYPGDLTTARIAELAEALAETIIAWERGEL